MSTCTHARARRRAQRLHTIGSVCRRLQAEFPDISISKIRYLEDQGLLTPRRTRGGYRLFGEEDVERLADDPAAPARRVPAAARDPPGARLAEREGRASAAAPAGARSAREDEVDLDELCERAGISRALARELEEFGLLAPRVEAASGSTPERTSTSRRLRQARRVGIAPRHLRAFRTAADREAGLLEAVVAPALRSRNPERRQAALEDLQALGSSRRSSRSSSSGGTCGGRPRSEKERAAMAAAISPRSSATSRTSRSRGSSSRTSCRCSRPRGAAPGGRAARRVGRAAGAGPRARRRGARLHHRRCARLPARHRLRRRAQAGMSSASMPYFANRPLSRPAHSGAMVAVIAL